MTADGRAATIKRYVTRRLGPDVADDLVGRYRRDEVRMDSALARTGVDPVTEPFTGRRNTVSS